MKGRFIKPAVLLGLLILAVSVIAFNACSKSGGSYGNNGGNNSGNGSGNSVSIKGFAFSVGSLNIAPGTTVTWTNNDATNHTVTADDNSFDSGTIPPGGTFSHKFPSAGTTKYHCSIHTSMKAAVVVSN